MADSSVGFSSVPYFLNEIFELTLCSRPNVVDCVIIIQLALGLRSSSALHCLLFEFRFLFLSHLCSPDMFRGFIIHYPRNISHVELLATKE